MEDARNEGQKLLTWRKAGRTVAARRPIVAQSRSYAEDMPAQRSSSPGSKNCAHEFDDLQHDIEVKTGRDNQSNKSQREK
jgi:hypothetical protein